MVRFLLNEKIVTTSLSPGLQLLDLIRYHQNLKGTKIGCREGDCGACTVLVGTLMNGTMSYRSMTSCLLPLANVNGKHVVTIEGLNPCSTTGDRSLNFIQSCLAAEGATQCGFCTPGFVVSLAGYCLGGNHSEKKSVAAIDGNICRCTGYKSIMRAALKINAVMEERGSEDALIYAVRQKMIPEYFLKVREELSAFESSDQPVPGNSGLFVAGGTDLYVQQPEKMVKANLQYLSDEPGLREIYQQDNRIAIGGSATVTDLLESPVINNALPAFPNYSKLVSSTPIRNMATVAGNIINASPIGDLSVMLLALDAKVELEKRPGDQRRNLMLNELFTGYKQLARSPDEIIRSVSFERPGANDFFHFEKVSKRTHLDIASVNTAILLRMEGNRIVNGHLSAGGVSPIPLLLRNTSASLADKTINEGLVEDVVRLAMSEISPISDARGSREYKSLLLAQLIRAHFHTLVDKINSAA